MITLRTIQQHRLCWSAWTPWNIVLLYLPGLSSLLVFLLSQTLPSSHSNSYCHFLSLRALITSLSLVSKCSTMWILSKPLEIRLKDWFKYCSGSQPWLLIQSTGNFYRDINNPNDHFSDLIGPGWAPGDNIF